MGRITGAREGKGGVSVYWVQVSLCKMGSVLEMGGAGYTTVWMALTPLNCTFKKG